MRHLLVVISTLIVILVQGNGTIVFGQSQDLSKGERWLRTQYGYQENDRTADLLSVFPDSADRVVSAELICAILAVRPWGSDKRHKYSWYSTYENWESRFPNLPFHLCHATIDGDVDLSGFEILNPVSFSSCHFSGNVVFDRAHFFNSLLFDSSCFAAQLSFSSTFFDEDVKFQNTYGNNVSFTSLKSIKSIVVEQCAFKYLSFDDATIGLDLDIQGLLISDSTLSLRRGTINRHLSIIRLNSRNGISAEFCTVRGYTNVLIIAPTSGPINFRSITGDGPVAFESTDSLGIFNLQSARLYSLNVGRTYVGGRGISVEILPLIKEIDLSRSIIQNDLKVNCVRASDFTARGLVVRGDTEFKFDKFVNELDLQQSSFSTLGFFRVSFPHRDQRNFSGVKYESLPTNSECLSHLWVAESTAFRADVYATLEEYYRRTGELDWSDDVFIAKNNRQAPLRSGFRRAWLFIIRGIGYGRHPENAVFVSIGLFILGIFLFRGAWMAVNDTSPPNRYDVVWYTLELILPVVNLHIAEKWAPVPAASFSNRTVRFRQHIAFFLSKFLPIWGWILVTILVASLTGIVG